MTKFLLVVATVVASTFALAAPASADPLERRCTSVNIAGFDTIQVCYYLPGVKS